MDSLQIKLLTSHLQSDLKLIGFGPVADDEIAKKIGRSPKGFSLEKKMLFGTDRLYVKLMVRPGDYGPYEITTTNATLRQDIGFQRYELRGVDISDLDWQMRQVDWQNDYFDRRKNLSSDLQMRAEGLLNQLEKLRDKDSSTNLAYDLLVWKYLLDTPNERYLSNTATLREQFDFNHVFEPGLPSRLNMDGVYKLLSGRAIRFSTYEDAPYNNLAACYIYLHQQPGQSILKWDFRDAEIDIKELFKAGLVQGWDDSPKVTNMAEAMENGNAVKIRFELSDEFETYSCWLDARQNTLRFGRSQDIDLVLFSQARGSLKSLGIPYFDAQILRAMTGGTDSMDLHYHLDLPGCDKAEIKVHLFRDTSSDSLHPYNGLLPVDYSASLTRVGDVPTVFVDEVSSRVIEEKMRAIDWRRMDWWQFGHPAKQHAADLKLEQINANWVFEQLIKLYKKADGFSAGAADALAMKYFFHTPNEYFMLNLKDLENRYKESAFASCEHEPYLSATDLMTLLQGNTLRLDYASEEVCAYLRLKDGAVYEDSYPLSRWATQNQHAGLSEDQERARRKLKR